MWPQEITQGEIPVNIIPIRKKYIKRKSGKTFIYCYLVNYDQRRQWHPTPVLLPGKSHGRRSLVGCSPWGHEESDMTEVT